MASRGNALEMAVLGLLHDAPLHGYELRKQVTGLLGWGRVLSYGTLYPCLKSLLRRGLLAAEPGESGRAGGSARRPRITYALTDAGRARFTELVTDAGPSAWDDDHFGVHFAFFAHGDARTRVRVLEGRRSRLVERLERARTALPRTRGGRTDPYTNELQRHGIETVEREVGWLSELIETERAGIAPGATAQSEPTPSQPTPSQPTPSQPTPSEESR